MKFKKASSAALALEDLSGKPVDSGAPLRVAIAHPKGVQSSLDAKQTREPPSLSSGSSAREEHLQQSERPPQEHPPIQQ